MIELGSRIKELRENRGYSIAELAYKSGVSGATICRCENGRRKPSIDAISKIADVFEVTVDYMLGKESEVTENPAHNDPQLVQTIAKLYAILQDPAKRAVIEELLQIIHK